MNNKDKIGTVQRITVDERLSEDLIRLEICELKEPGESGEFKDEPDFWRDIAQDREEVLARPNNSGKGSRKDYYVDLMFIPEAQVRQFPWKDLEEGQVFLSGEFKVKKERRKGKKGKRYFIRPGKKVFKRIDDDVKENTKALYYEVLAKGEKNGKL